MDLQLDEPDRQMLLLAMAVLSLINPGFDHALNEIALRIDNNVEGRAQMYDAFRRARADTVGVGDKDWLTEVKARLTTIESRVAELRGLIRS